MLLLLPANLGGHSHCWTWNLGSLGRCLGSCTYHWGWKMLVPAVMPKEPGLVFLSLRVSCLLLAGELLNCRLYPQISSSVQCYSAPSIGAGETWDGQKGHEYRGHGGRRSCKVCGHQEWVQNSIHQPGDSQIPLSMLGTGVMVTRQIKKPVRTWGQQRTNHLRFEKGGEGGGIWKRRQKPNRELGSFNLNSLSKGECSELSRGHDNFNHILNATFRSSLVA